MSPQPSVIIAGRSKDTKNYEKALADGQVLYETNLYPEECSSYSGLLLPGGGDIHPSYFGQSDRGSKKIEKELDRAQFALLDAFVQMGRPVFGICRGMQLINVYFGGDVCCGVCFVLMVSICCRDISLMRER